MNFWAVVQCETQREHAARLLLMRQAFTTYLPRIKIRNRITALFPAYLFVQPHDQWFQILSTPYVVRLLMSGNKPARLPDEIITSIRKREIGGFVKLPTPRRLKKGQKVRIVRGNFEGQIGLYEGMSGKDRERVLLELLGQIVPVELPARDIRPLDIVAVSRETRY